MYAYVVFVVVFVCRVFFHKDDCEGCGTGLSAFVSEPRRLVIRYLCSVSFLFYSSVLLFFVLDIFYLMIC